MSNQRPPIRVYRDWKWITVRDPNPMIGGPPPAQKLVPVDRIQYLDFDGEYKDAPIVEAPKPKNPVEEQLDKQRAELRNRSAQNISTALGMLALAAGKDKK